VTSADAKNPPIIDPKYYSHPLDLEIMSRALLRALDVATAEPLCTYIKDNGKKTRNDARDHDGNGEKHRGNALSSGWNLCNESHSRMEES